MREWLSGGAPPCQGGGRGFDPRLALSKITKRTSEWEVLFCYPRSAGHFSIPNCFAVWVRFLGTLKRPSVVPKPRSTGPCGTRLALLLIKRTSKWEVLFLLSEKCGALLETQLLRSLDSISRDAKAPLGRAKAKVHWTLWHPARALLDNKKDFRMRSPFFVIREVRGSSRYPTALQFGFDFSGR